MGLDVLRQLPWPRFSMLFSVVSQGILEKWARPSFPITEAVSQNDFPPHLSQIGPFPLRSTLRHSSNQNSHRKGQIAWRVHVSASSSSLQSEHVNSYRKHSPCYCTWRSVFRSQLCVVCAGMVKSSKGRPLRLRTFLTLGWLVGWLVGSLVDRYRFCPAMIVSTVTSGLLCYVDL
jgi:hypothetical protein